MARSLWKAFISALISKKRNVVPIADLNMQTRVLPDGSRICSLLPTDELKTHRYDDARTLYEGARRGARVSTNGPMLGYRINQEDGTRPYVWISYDEAIERSEDIGRALRKMDQPVGQNTFIGICSKNRPEWVLIEHATYVYGNVLVPLYDTFGIDAATFIINQANLEVIFCDDLEHVQGLLQAKSKCPCLKHIVIIGARSLSDNFKNKALRSEVQLYTLDELEKMGVNAAKELQSEPIQPPKPEDLCTISYTSGTTGAPKGVMLTHGNVIADCTTLDYFKHSDISHEDVSISFLPLPHMFERVVQATMFMKGASVGFFSGDIRFLADDIKVLRPTFMPVVPRLLGRVHDEVLTQVSKSKIRKFVFSAAIDMKTAELESGLYRKDSLADKIVFNKIQDSFGGRLKLMATGSAPISDELLTFARCAVGGFVVEGYGQTECVAACTVSFEGDFVPGHVGAPSPCNAVKLIDVPEMNYFAKDQVGEVCVRGHNVFKGYFKMPEETKLTLDADGWLHTGDIGKWTDRGTLKIVDRKKHIFKLSQGEYVAPEKVECIYLSSKYVAQCFVYGESLKSRLVGVIVPNQEILTRIAESKLDVGRGCSFEELCNSAEVKELVLEDILEVGKAAGLASFEQVKDVCLSSVMFSVDNGLLTPTLKSKRPKLKQNFQKEIDAMYDNIS